MTDRIVTDADRAPEQQAGVNLSPLIDALRNKRPSDQVMDALHSIMLNSGYSEFEISTGIETVVYKRKQFGL